VNSKDEATLERAAKQLERARTIWRAVPALEYTKYWRFPSVAPAPVGGTLSNLWAVYLKLKRPASESQAVFAEALDISRPVGEAAVNGTLASFAVRAIDIGGDAPNLVLEASRGFGIKAELWTLRALSGAGRSYRPEAAEKALLRALEIGDSHEQAVMLEWYGRMRYQTMVRDASSPVFEQLLQRCIESGEVALVTEAMAYEADNRLTQGETESALALYRRAIQVADGAGDARRAAELASRRRQPNSVPARSCRAMSATSSPRRPSGTRSGPAARWNCRRR